MTSTCPGSAAVKEKYERLPDYASPTHYNIRLEPDFSTFTFKGHVAINVTTTKPTKELKVHAKALNIGAISLKLANGQELRDLQHTYSEKSTMATIALPVEVSPQNVQLNIDFMGVHNEKMQGFYRSKYTQNGKEHWMLSTQFESTSAREAFPCWDEPIFKATYDVTLVVDDGLTALSNAPVKSESKDGKKHTVVFETTPKMSSYLVAFAVGNFEYIEQKSAKGILIRVYTTPGKKEQGRFALEVGTKAIDWYADWFGTEYMMSKCDMIAVPDFAFGAMENIGLVTFREIALLFDAEKTSTKQKTYVALVIAHELAHLWFGDLVTMKWWTDLWLKEGFASFMEYLFVAANYPEMKIWLHFLNDELSSGFELDALKNSHPIEVPIDNPNELDEIYDSITYAKSNSCNRMLFFYLGEKAFQKGLRLYLQRFKFSNAETKDLWQCLSEASGVDVMSVMSTWTKQMGFPVVSISKVSQDDKHLKLQFKQTRFIADGSEDSASQLWKVPITLSTASNPDKPVHKFVLDERTEEHTFDVPKGDWIKANQGTTGFYRVQYSDELLQPLLKAVGDQSLPVLDRFGLSNDLFALANAGQVPISQVLSLFENSLKENEYAVWRTLDLGIARISDAMAYADSDGALGKRFNRYVVGLLAKVLDRFGWGAAEKEDGQVSLLRALLVGRLCKAGHQPSINKAMELFRAYIETNTPIHTDLRMPIFGAAIRSGGDKEFEQLRDHYEKAEFPEVQRAALIALGQTTATSGRLEKLFDYAVAQGKVRPQDLMQIFLVPSITRAGQQFVCSYFKNNLSQLMDKFGGVNSTLFQRCFKSSAQESCLEETAADVKKFFCGKVDSTALGTLDRPIKQVVEQICNNAKFLAFATSQVDKFLKERGFCSQSLMACFRIRSQFGFSHKIVLTLCISGLFGLASASHSLKLDAICSEQNLTLKECFFFKEIRSATAFNFKLTFFSGMISSLISIIMMPYFAPFEEKFKLLEPGKRKIISFLFSIVFLIFILYICLL